MRGDRNPYGLPITLGQWSWGRVYEACYVEFDSLTGVHTLAVGYGVWSSKPKRVCSIHTKGAKLVGLWVTSS